MSYKCVANKTNRTMGYTENNTYDCDFVHVYLSSELTEIINDNGDRVIVSAKDFDFLKKSKTRKDI